MGRGRRGHRRRRRSGHLRLSGTRADERKRRAGHFADGVHVYIVRGAKIVERRLYGVRAKALEAAGLSE